MDRSDRVQWSSYLRYRPASCRHRRVPMALSVDFITCMPAGVQGWRCNMLMATMFFRRSYIVAIFPPRLARRRTCQGRASYALQGIRSGPPGFSQRYQRGWLTPFPVAAYLSRGPESNLCLNYRKKGNPMTNPSISVIMPAP
jgi:hypothetical protein